MLEVRTLTDGGQSAPSVLAWIEELIGGAKRTLDFAHYDLNLGPENASVVREAIRAADARGVAVRFLYNIDHRNPIPVPPPPEPDAELIASFDVPARAIAGVPDLMHHKYVVRDGETVWTGSMNWTDDSFTRQENVVALVRSTPLAARFEENFAELWKTGAVELTRARSSEPCAGRRAKGARVVHAGATARRSRPGSRRRSREPGDECGSARR